MKTFDVRMRVTKLMSYKIEAESAKEARRKAEEFDLDDPGTDCDTLDWEITSVKELAS